MNVLLSDMAIMFKNVFSTKRINIAFHYKNICTVFTYCIKLYQASKCDQTEHVRYRHHRILLDPKSTCSHSNTKNNTNN
jgi:hypothetical protein